jgi:GGDEF domain-containing protein
MKKILHYYPQLRGIKKHFFWVAAPIIGILIQLYFIYPMSFQTQSLPSNITLLSESFLLSAFMIFALIVVLSSKIPSKSTTWMTSGILLLFFSFSHDFFIGFFSTATAGSNIWLSIMSFYPIGLFVITVSLLYWHKEQLQINRLLNKRNFKHLKMDLIDPSTGLLTSTLLKESSCKKLFSDTNLIMAFVDIKNLSRINNQISYADADAYLIALSDLFLLNIHKDELLLRYAGDKFIFLFPKSSLESVTYRMLKIINLQENFHFFGQFSKKEINTSSHFCLLKNNEKNIFSMIENAKQQISKTKNSEKYLLNS